MAVFEPIPTRSKTGENDVENDFNTLFRMFIGRISGLHLRDQGIPTSKLIGAGVRVYQSAGQNISDNTNTALTFDTESFDTDGFHSVASNTSRLTVPTGFGGKYLISGNYQIAANATGYRRCFINLNGATTIGISSVPTASASVNSELTVGTTYDLVDGDYVELNVYQNSTGTLATVAGAGGSHFSMMRLGS